MKEIKSMNSRTYHTKSILLTISVAVFSLLNVYWANTQPLIVKTNQPGAAIQPTMWGIFFEDINFAADGGLYAELVKNRSFEFAQPMMGWKDEQSDRFSLNKESGSTMVINRQEENDNNPRFARVTVNADKDYVLANEGFRGMGIRMGEVYNFSILVRPVEGNTRLHITLTDPTGNIIGETRVVPRGNSWNKYTGAITAAASNPKAMLNIAFEGRGVIDLDMVSLFPSHTWKNRPNGLRADLVQLLADLQPGFLRFPGGCIVEGRDLASRYQWKKTVGDVAYRKTIVNRWNTEFNHRLTPDYYQSFGLGFFEYFQLAEDIGAEPLPILNCGMACQFNTAEVVPLNELDPFIQDALDLIEFANGDTTATWGKVRAHMGHPAPFHMKFIGVGNEQWGPQYFDRYKLFVEAIKGKYPEITIVTGAGPFPDGELFDYAYDKLRPLKAEIVDEHYYRNPSWFLQNATRYDSYDRNGPKVFAGEYAAQSVAIASPDNKNNWNCALSEAAFMTGLERNADIVHLASYAPLFGNAEGWQWTPDLIWFDNLRAYGTTDYYVQKLFSTNKGTRVIPIVRNNQPVTGQDNLYASAVSDEPTNEIILKLVNASGSQKNQHISMEGAGKLAASAELTILSSNQLDGVNTLDNPEAISPVHSTVAIKGKQIDLTLPAYSVSVIKFRKQ